MITLDRIFPPAAGQHARLQGGMGSTPSLFCRRSSARGRRAAAKPTRPTPPGAIRRKGAKALPLIMGELANSLKGRNGGERANRMEARLSARPLGGLGARGTSGGVDPGTRRAAARGSAGGEGPRGFFSRAGKDAVLLPPAVCPLWRVPVLKGGSRKGGFQRGKTDGGKQHCRNRVAALPLKAGGPPKQGACSRVLAGRSRRRQRSGRNFEP